MYRKPIRRLLAGPAICFMSSHRRANWTSRGIIRRLDESGKACWLHQQMSLFSLLYCGSWRFAFVAGESVSTYLKNSMVTPKSSNWCFLSFVLTEKVEHAVLSYSHHKGKPAQQQLSHSTLKDKYFPGQSVILLFSLASTNPGRSQKKVGE